MNLDRLAKMGVINNEDYFNILPALNEKFVQYLLDNYDHEEVVDFFEQEDIKMIPDFEIKINLNAHWIPKDIMERRPFAKNYYCSNCKVDTIECSNFCGNCGAKMNDD